MSNPFADDLMAAGYAAARPPVHPRVIGLLRDWLGEARPATAVDVGCGAGLSTRPLLDLARHCVGFDPAEVMVRAAARVAPGARFVTAAAESMPLATGTVDLLAAAGSLNYTRELDAVWPEAARVLAPGGTFAVYDFSAARAFADGDPTLDAWFTAFRERHPAPTSQAIPLSPAILAERAAGFSVTRGEDFVLPLELTPDFYVSYMLTETNVRDATRRGTPLDDIRTWCETTLAPVFGGRPRTVLFRGYLAIMEPA
jgi:SAM-dependent methyltransferase